MKDVAFVFKNKSSDRWRFLSHFEKIKHVDCIMSINNTCIAFLIRLDGIKVKVLNNPLDDIVKRLWEMYDTACVIQVRVKDDKVKTRFPLIASCNEMCRRLANLNIGFSINPASFARKLLRLDNKRNYTVIDARVKNGTRCIG